LEYQKIAVTGEITEGTSKAFKTGELDIVVFRYQGDYYALRRWCTHLGGYLSKGLIEDKVVTCPRHGSQFDITTGKNLRGPKIGIVRWFTGSETSYPVKVEGQDVLVGLPDQKAVS
jgi:3-phenylpropionate/trans-cinnamate dioxygenase ferredoxin subunit